VVDGDTVRLAGLGTVRLIGVDTPEVYGERIECFGPQASAFARRVLRPGSDVRYRVGREARDRYGRLLVYLWLTDGRLFNRMLVTRGYATTLTIPPNDELAESFRAAEGDARRARLGIWRAPGCADTG
jgi:micrococcal nuclease